MAFIQGNVIKLPGVAPLPLADLDQGDPTTKLILTCIRATDLSEHIAEEIKNTAADQVRSAQRIEDAARAFAAVAEGTQNENKLNLELIRYDVNRVATSSAEALATMQSLSTELHELLDASIAAQEKNFALRKRLASESADIAELEKARSNADRKWRTAAAANTQLEQQLANAQKRKESELAAARAIADKRIAKLSLELGNGEKNQILLWRLVAAQIFVIAFLVVIILVK